MVKLVEIDGKKYYVCEDCKLIFKDKSWAEKCQAWCELHKTCNIEITKHSNKEVYRH